jgi:hypothetical protein
MPDLEARLDRLLDDLEPRLSAMERAIAEMRRTIDRLTERTAHDEMYGRNSSAMRSNNQ